MAGIIKSVLSKQGAKGEFWILVIDNEEVMCFDPICKTLEGKENPYEIATSGSGKKYLKIAKAGGFQGKSGGGWKGRSDKELYLQALTMSMAYAKDLVVPMITNDNTVEWVKRTTVEYYKEISTNILADLKLLCPEVPVVATEAPKTEAPTTYQPVQKTAPRQAAPAPPDTSNMTVKEKLKKEMDDYLRNTHSDTDDNFRTLLMTITAFTGKDGNEVSLDNFDKLSEKWAGSSIKKLRELVDEEERKGAAEMSQQDDINF